MSFHWEDKEVTVLIRLKSSEKYLFVRFDNLDLRSFSSHMISQFWLEPSLSTIAAFFSLNFCDIWLRSSEMKGVCVEMVSFIQFYIKRVLSFVYLR